MEVALEVNPCQVAGAIRHRFNPCFRGSSSGSMEGIEVPYEEWGFNPCFRGSSSGRTGEIYEYMSISEFQSLFSWK